MYYLFYFHAILYHYIQVSKDISNKETEEREYRPFYMIKDLYPRYLFTMDILLQKRDGINHLNIVDFIYNNRIFSIPFTKSQGLLVSFPAS